MDFPPFPYQYQEASSLLPPGRPPEDETFPLHQLTSPKHHLISPTPYSASPIQHPVAGTHHLEEGLDLALDGGGQLPCESGLDATLVAEDDDLMRL